MIKKSDPNKIINLQNGLYCHITDGHMVINDDMNYDGVIGDFDLSKSSNRKKTRIIINIIYSAVIIGFSIYAEFFPTMLLLFLSVFDLKQLKRYDLPLNKSRTLPFENIDHIKFNEGKLGFNYMDVVLLYNGKKTMVPLKLYDSRSSLAHAKDLIEKIGSIEIISSKKRDPKISGPYFPVSENAGYILSEGTFYYCLKGKFDPKRLDSFKYMRIIAFVSLLFVLYALVTKLIMMNQGFNTAADYTVILIFILVSMIPLKYMRKAMPNYFSVSEIKSIKVIKSKIRVVIKKDFPLPMHVFLALKSEDEVSEFKKAIAKEK